MKRYPKYKDSGVEWIGEIPRDWDVVLFKRIYKKIKDGTHGTFVRVTDGNPLLSAKNVFTDGIKITDEESLISEEDFHEIVKNGFPQKNDLLLTIVGTIGRTFVYDKDYPLAFQRSVLFIRLKKDVNPYFYYYLFQSSLFLDLLASLAKTSAQSGIYMKDISDLIVLKLPEGEQKSITNYLDHKIHLIDTLIGKKQKRIELLKEQRTAIINQAVTKGLNSNVKMRDSGIEWLGKVPVHWEIKKFKHLLKRKKGAIKTGPFGSQLKGQDFVDSGVKVYNQRTVLDNDFSNGTHFISQEKYLSLQSFEVFPDDILITSRGTIGKCAIVPTDADKGVLHPCLIRLQTDPTIVFNEYLSWYIQESEYFKESVVFESDATTIEVIYSDTLKNIRIPVPPIEEQQVILRHLVSMEKTFGKCIESLKQEVEFIFEYRTTLISEAVTGKIDVRNEVIS